MSKFDISLSVVGISYPKNKPILSHSVKSEEDSTSPTKRHKYSAGQGYRPEGSSSSTAVGGGALGPDWHSHMATRGFKSADKRVQVEYGAEVKSLAGDPGRFRREDFGDITVYDDEDDWNVHVELTNGKVVGCDFVVSATGVVPNGDTISVVESAAAEQRLKLCDEGGSLNFSCGSQ